MLKKVILSDFENGVYFIKAGGTTRKFILSR